MDEPYIPSLAKLRKRPYLAVAITLFVCGGLILLAYSIGNAYSCAPIANIYYLAGLASLPLLFSIPFMFFPKLHVAQRLFLGFLWSSAGIAVWAWAFDASGMYFLCRLF